MNNRPKLNALVGRRTRSTVVDSFGGVSTDMSMSAPRDGGGEGERHTFFDLDGELLSLAFEAQFLEEQAAVHGRG